MACLSAESAIDVLLLTLQGYMPNCNGMVAAVHAGHTVGFVFT